MNNDDLNQQIRALELRGVALADRAYAVAPHSVPLVAEALGLLQSALELLRATRHTESESESTDLREELIESATHDLKNLLSIVSGNAQQLIIHARSHETIPAAKVVVSLSSVNTAAMQMGRLVDELRTVLVLKGALPPLDRHPIDLVALAQRMVDLYQLVTDKHRIALVTAVPTLIGVFDEGRLERVFSNLLSNAIKYSPRGGAITITLDQIEDNTGSWAVVEVHDQGVGVPSADLPHMFERFHRGTNVRDHIEGHGVGLASARRVAEQHGGMLTATSAEGVGTTLTLRLPLSRFLARGVGAGS